MSDEKQNPHERMLLLVQRIMAATDAEEDEDVDDLVMMVPVEARERGEHDAERGDENACAGRDDITAMVARALAKAARPVVGDIVAEMLDDSSLWKELEPLWAKYPPAVYADPAERLFLRKAICHGFLIAPEGQDEQFQEALLKYFLRDRNVVA